MSHFRAIVQSDVKQMEQLAPGVAMALTWWGGVYKNFKLQLGVQDFYLLADFFGKTSEYSQYLSFDVKSEINELLYGYISEIASNFKSQENIQFLSFNHDTLAEEGISYVALETGEPNTHLQQAKILDYAVEKLSDRVASRLLTSRLRERDFFKDTQKKIDLIEKLRDRGCTYHLTGSSPFLHTYALESKSTLSCIKKRKFLFFCTIFLLFALLIYSFFYCIQT